MALYVYDLINLLSINKNKIFVKVLYDNNTIIIPLYLTLAKAFLNLED